MLPAYYPQQPQLQPTLPLPVDGSSDSRGPALLPAANPAEGVLARRVAATVCGTGFAQLVIVRDDRPRCDNLEDMGATKRVDVHRTRLLLMAYSIVECFLCVIFLILGVYGFDKSSYTPCPPYCYPYYSSSPYTCPAARPACPKSDDYDNYYRLTRAPMTPSFAKFAYTNVMGRSLVVLALLPTIGRHPDIGMAVGVINAIINAAFTIAAFCLAWVDMKGREFAGFYQIPLTILGIVSLTSPVLLIYLTSSIPTPHAKNALVVQDAGGNEAMVVDDVSTSHPATSFAT